MKCGDLNIFLGGRVHPFAHHLVAGSARVGADQGSSGGGGSGTATRGHCQVFSSSVRAQELLQRLRVEVYPSILPEQDRRASDPGGTNITCRPCPLRSPTILAFPWSSSTGPRPEMGRCQTERGPYEPTSSSSLWVLNITIGPVGGAILFGIFLNGCALGIIFGLRLASAFPAFLRFVPLFLAVFLKCCFSASLDTFCHRLTIMRMVMLMLLLIKLVGLITLLLCCS